jgi:hypothetical protein
MVCFENDPASDPNQAKVTDAFRKVGEPENTLVGVLYRSLGNSFPWVCSNPTHWAFEGTGMAAGNSIAGVCGHEYDVVGGTPYAGQSPDGLQIIANSPVTDQYGVSFSSQSTYYTHRSGAGVFAIGTIQWSWALDSFDLDVNYADSRAQRITQNVLNHLIAQGRATFLPQVLWPRSDKPVHRVIRE